MAATLQNTVNRLNGLDSISQNPGFTATFKGTLSGDEPLVAVRASQATTASASKPYNASLSGSDGYSALSGGFGSASRTSSSGGLSSGSDVSYIGRVSAESGPGRPTIIWDTSSPYYFMGSMSEEVMHRYLDKAIAMANISMPGNGGGPATNSSYDPLNTAISLEMNKSLLYDPAYLHGQDLLMLQDLQPKMVLVMAFWWSDLCDQYLDWVCITFGYDANFIQLRAI
jgi:hypothetical protein